MEIHSNMELKFPTIPLRNHFIIPGISTTIIVGRKESLEALKISKESFGSKVLLVPQVDTRDEEITSPSQLQSIGTLCEILDIIKLPDSSQKVHLKGLEIVEVYGTENIGNIWKSSHVVREISIFDKQKSEILDELLFENIKKYSKINRAITSNVLEYISQKSDIINRLYKIIGYLKINYDETINLFKILNYEELALIVVEIMVSEIEKSKVKLSIDKAVRKNIEKIQKKVFLSEQLKEIKTQLNGETSQSSSYKDKIENIKSLDKKIKNKLIKDAEKLEHTHQSSPEYTVLINYLDVIVDLPWDKESKFSIDIKKAKEKLDKDHYGLEKVKNKILEHLSVMKLKNENSGSILCLVGPPGVGKSTLAKSIARSMDREFVNLSLGGLTDEAELRGHRKTYIGAMPGQIIKKINSCGVKNPVFLLDEVDKIGNGYKGDPSSILLEILDKEQNNKFTDNYIDIPFDLSKVMFILTANSLNTISHPLLDRVEIIELSSYLYPEKIEIAKKYLVPKVLKDMGIEGNIPVTIKQSAIDIIVKRYTRESGVRNLKRSFETVAKKIAKKSFEEEIKNRLFITKSNIEEYLGKPIYRQKDILSKNSIGNVVGLAWTQVGGVILFVQATIFKSSSSKFILTGRMGDVMKESSSIALTVAKKYCKNKIAEDFYETNEIHIHIPDGAVPKDGPSAGITLTTALVSAILKKKVDKTIAMTGELSLVGDVLPIGGLREKLTAAISGGVKKVLVPSKNLKDIEELPDYILKNIEIQKVSKIEDVLDVVLV